MGRSTVHYTDSKTNTILKALHNKLRPAGTPVQRVEYIIELLLLRIFEVKLKREDEFKQLRRLFAADTGNDKKLFYYLQTVGSEKILAELNQNFFPFYANILNHAHTVIKGNLKDKVQDQLILIQDVFANSNFTNNVQSGNLEEIINLIADIDEDRLLKTDLLGDSIESALSETGGTKDIGLFRTPDHVRQFMVGLLQPKITDNIFDPACGTGGFLFDSFGFVTESISQDDNWPGPKAHPELQKWFKNYFKKNPAPMPTIEQTHQFYRSGIYGTEYLGMIRKMAAVNFYVRGLNPHNIEQGDSLAKFNKELQFKNTFSIVLANPPFGAERDQKAYPNIWEEFAKESETTILFVKLMLDALKSDGKCAVVVSEGFLTWDQTSAKTLRHMLLTEANLQAVIGLPQGVFVSKNGQGPKTSILVFEKGKQTKDVWFYNIENDGFTKGANRTPIEGCQITEALEIYHKYIRHGKTAPETKNSFTLSVDWLTIVDPRIKEKIHNETTAEIEEKKGIAKAALLERLNRRLKNTKTDKFGKKEYDAEIYKFECVWQQKLQNEIAKRIDKAHSYSLNSSTYRSNLTEKQLEQWCKAVAHHTPEKNGHSLDKRFALLKESKFENAITHIATFDPQNAIESDIVREYLANIEQDILKKYPALKTLDEIFKSGAKYPIVKIGNYLILNENKLKPCKSYDIKFTVLGVSNETGIFVNRDLNPQDTNQSYYLVEPNQFCYNPYRVNVGSIGLNKFDYENQIISGAYIIFGTDNSKLLPEYLLALFSDKRFLDYVNSKANGGVRMNFTFEDLGNWNIPLPPPAKQLEIVQQIEKQKAVIDGTEKILNNWSLHLSLDDYPKYPLYKYVHVIRGYNPPKKYFSSKPLCDHVRFVQIRDFETDEHLTYVPKSNRLKMVKKNEILMAAYRHIGKVNRNMEGAYNVALIKFKTRDPQTLSEDFLYHLIPSKYIREELLKVSERAHIPSTSLEIINNLHIPIPPLKVQLEIVDSFNSNVETIERIQQIKMKAQMAILKTIASLWEV